MAGRVQWEAQVDSNIKQLLGEAKQLRDELDGIKKGNYEIKLNIDEKKLENVISNLDKMLTSLGKGTGDFKEFETLSKQLKDIVSEVQTLNKAFGNINDSGVSELLSSIKNIDKLLSSLSEHIVGVNKDFSNIGKNASDNVGQINEAKKATEGLTEATKELANAQKNVENSDQKSYEDNVIKYKKKLESFKIKPDDGHSYESWKNDISKLNAQIERYESLVKSANSNDGIISPKDIEEANILETSIENMVNTMSKKSFSERGWTDLSASKTAEKINSILEKNTKMSKEAKKQIRAYYNEIRSGNPSAPLNEILDKCIRIEQQERAMGRAGKSWLEIFNTKRLHSFLGQAASMFSFYDIINVARQAGQAVIDLNTNITELAKVSEASASQIYDDFNSYANIAKEVGGTISDTISATADWSRNGYNIPDAKELAEVAMIYKNVGDGIDIDQANEYLISTLRGFKLEAKDAMDIIDSINEVANNEPISSAGIGEALQRSAAAFNAANTSLQESIALVTSTNSVLQSPEKVGSMWTTVSARIRGATTELEEAGLETDGMIESTSKLQALIKGMTGFDILEDDGETFKSIYDIIIGIGEEWKNLSDINQASLLEALAGKRQSNALAATLNNIDLLKKAYGEATNAEGSALEEQKKYQESIQYSIDRTKASLEELANDFLSSDFLKWLIDSGDKLINILDLLIEKFGLLGTTAIVGGGILGKQNLGKTYKRTVFKLNCFEYALYA